MYKNSPPCPVGTSVILLRVFLLPISFRTICHIKVVWWSTTSTPQPRLAIPPSSLGLYTAGSVHVVFEVVLAGALSATHGVCPSLILVLARHSTSPRGVQY